MAGSKETNPTLLLAERFHCFKSGTREVHVIWRSSHARSVKLGLWLRARCSGRGTLKAIPWPNRTGVVFLGCCMKIRNHRNPEKKKKYWVFEFFCLFLAGKSIQSPMVLFRDKQVRKMIGGSTELEKMATHGSI